MKGFNFIVAFMYSLNILDLSLNNPKFGLPMRFVVKN